MAQALVVIRLADRYAVDQNCMGISRLSRARSPRAIRAVRGTPSFSASRSVCSSRPRSMLTQITAAPLPTCGRPRRGLVRRSAACWGAPGRVVKFTAGGRLVVESGATVDAPATQASPIVITSLADDSAGGDTGLDGGQTRPGPGDWDGFAVTPGGNFIGVFSRQIGGGAVEVANTIISNSIFGILNQSPVTINYSDVWSPTGSNWAQPIEGSGNVSVDPKYKDAARGDYRLRYRSPAIDAADGAAAPANDITGAPALR